MVGRPLPALAGVKVMSLVMATRLSSAGITNRLPPPGKGCTRRAGTWTVASPSTSRRDVTKAA